jgi:hypothetical protein
LGAIRHSKEIFFQGMPFQGIFSRGMSFPRKVVTKEFYFQGIFLQGMPFQGIFQNTLFHILVTFLHNQIGFLHCEVPYHSEQIPYKRVVKNNFWHVFHVFWSESCFLGSRDTPHQKFQPNSNKKKFR